MLNIPHLVCDGGVRLGLLHLVLRGDDVLQGRVGGDGVDGRNQVLLQQIAGLELAGVFSENRNH